jgi:hypothetical protein
LDGSPAWIDHDASKKPALRSLSLYPGYPDYPGFTGRAAAAKKIILQRASAASVPKPIDSTLHDH